MRTLPSSSGQSQLDMAHIFFERLWWYDQVVFDACLSREDPSPVKKVGIS
jgi:hypothetical protein